MQTVRIKIASTAVNSIFNHFVSQAHIGVYTIKVITNICACTASAKVLCCNYKTVQQSNSNMFDTPNNTKVSLFTY